MTDDWWIGLYSESDISVYSFTASPYLKTLQMFVHLSHIIIHRRIITVWCLFHNLSEMVQKVLKSNKFQLQQTQTRSFLYFKSQNKFETDMKEKKKSLDSPQDGQSASTRLSVWLFTTAFTRAVCSEENEKWLNTGWVSLWQICVYVCVLQCSGMWKVSGEGIYFCLQKPFFALWPTFLPCGQICFYWSGFEIHFFLEPNKWTRRCLQNQRQHVPTGAVKNIKDGGKYLWVERKMTTKRVDECLHHF